ncbi:MAG: type VI secretion system baseplate subunit TssG [Pseudomonadota bacterium]
MARADRRSPVDLKTQLLQEGKRFSFVQAMRLLHFLVKRQAGNDVDPHTLEQRIRCRPALSLDFPGTDITAIGTSGEAPETFDITATFLGLYGASSPLPTFYTEDLLHEQSDDKSITRDFLDIFNAPLYPLYFRGWGKYQLAYQIVEQEDPDTLHRLFSLLGLESPLFQRRLSDPMALLRYIGLTTQSPRSAEGLRALLSDALDAPRLGIVQCVTRLASIPEDQRCRLGISGASLGHNSYLGVRITDRMGKFRVHIGAADGQTLHRLLPDGVHFKKMTEMIGFYLDQPLTWDLEITVAAGETRHAGLGTDTWSRLGWNTWLFSGPPPNRELPAVFHAPAH